MKILRSLDQFGISYQQQIHKREKQFKSAFGGLVSLLLYALSLAYFLYKIALWINGDILPRVQVSKSTQSYADIAFDYNPIMFQVVGMSGAEFIDPFSKTENIITPFFSYVDDIVISKKQIMLNSSVPPVRTGLSTSVFPENVSLVLNQEGISDSSPKHQRQLMIMFERCNSSFYDNCASEEKQKNFFLQPLSTYFITIQMQQFNTRIKEFEMISKQIYFVLDGDSVLYTQVLFSITTSTSDTGFILESTKQSKFISNFQTTSQQLPQTNFEQSFGAKYLAVFLIGIDSLSETQLIIYPKLGEILADVGSIMSTLMLLRIIVITINTQILEDSLINTIISYYYPEMKFVKFKKNIFGKIVSAERNKQKVEECDNFIKFYQRLKEDTLEKLTIINILYEISRLQFIVQSIQSKNMIKQCHCIGIKLSYSNINNQSFQIDIREGSANPPKVFVKSAEKSRDEKNENYPFQSKGQQETLDQPKVCEMLTDEDFMILSHINHMKKIDDIEKNLPQFYNLNSVAY